MEGATEHLRTLARGIVDVTLERVPARGALLVGSAARGDADYYSDLDLILYVDQLPAEQVLAGIRAAVGGLNPVAKEATEHACGVEFELDGVRTEITFITVARVEMRLEQLLDRLEEIDTPVQKALLGVLEGLPLHGEELIERWQSRLRTFPEPLRRAMVERYWRFFPLWHYADAMAARDAELWRLDMLLEAAFNLLGVLAGLNRLYFSRFQLKWMRALIDQMEIAPPYLADRLESLFRLEPVPAGEELARLVEETRALVAAELPDLELALPFPTEARQQPWSR
jgi:predicted nucleotidyltransferase